MTRTTMLLTVALTVACATPEAPRQRAPAAPKARAETAYAAQIAQSELAGREIVRQYRARVLGESPTQSAPARRAVRAALAAEAERCAEDYAAIPIEGDVLGGPGEGLVAVYLVPLPADPAAIPIGGFHRITVDAETGDVVHTAPMSRGCRDLSLEAGDAASPDAVRSLLVTHDLTPYPLENHVVASLTAAVDLVVVTPGTTWRVVQGDVRALD